MPAKSKAQQKFMGMVHAYNKGDMKNAPSSVKKAANSMKKTDVEKYASTKHKGLPPKINQESIDTIKGYIKRRIGEVIQEADDGFDEKKMKKLVAKDRFLKTALNAIRGGNESARLKRLYLNLVFKDKKYEPLYKKIR